MRALQGSTHPAPRRCAQFLLGMIDHDDPDKVLEAICGAGGKTVKE